MTTVQEQALINIERHDCCEQCAEAAASALDKPARISWTVRLPEKQREAHFDDWRAVEIILHTEQDEYVQVYESVDGGRPALILDTKKGK